MSYNEAQHDHPAGVDLARTLRQILTPAERRLWARLRDRRLNGFKFRRQQPIGRFIVDFCCPGSQVVVEVDGDVHAEQRNYDAERSQWLERNGYRVLRFTNREVCGQLDSVLEAILRACEDRPSPLTPLPPSSGANGMRGLGEGGLQCSLSPSVQGRGLG